MIEWLLILTLLILRNPIRNYKDSRAQTYVERQKRKIENKSVKNSILGGRRVVGNPTLNHRWKRIRGFWRYHGLKISGGIQSKPLRRTIIKKKVTNKRFIALVSLVAVGVVVFHWSSLFVLGAAFTSKANGGWDQAGQTTWNEVGVPGAGDTVDISTHAIFLESSVTVTSLTISNVAGSLTTTDGTDWDLTVSGVTSITGTLTGNGSTISMLNCTINAGGLFDMSTGNVTMTQAGPTNCLLVNGNLNLGTGTHSIGITCTFWALSIGTGGTVNEETCTVTYGPVNVGNGATYTLTTGVTTIASAYVTIGDCFNVNAGATMNYSNGTLTFTYAGACSITNANATNPYNIIVNHASCVLNPKTNNLTIDNNLTITAGELTTTDGVDRDLTVDNTTTITAGTLTCNSSTISLGQGGATNIYALDFNGAGTYTGGTGTHTIWSVRTVTGGTLDLSTGNTIFNGANTGATPDVVIQINNGMTWNHNNGTCTFTLAGDQTMRDLNSVGAWTLFYDLVLNKASGTLYYYTVKQFHLTVVHDFTITAGTFDTSDGAGADGDLTIGGTTTILGTLTANSSTIAVAGNWDSSGGTFTIGTSTLQFTGNATFDPAYVDAWTANVYNMTIDDNVTVTIDSTNRTILGNVLTIDGTTAGGVTAGVFGVYSVSAAPFVLGANADFGNCGIQWRMRTNGATIAGCLNYWSIQFYTTQVSGFTNTFAGACNFASGLLVYGTTVLGDISTIDTGGFAMTTPNLVVGLATPLYVIFNCLGSTIDVGATGVTINVGGTIDCSAGTGIGAPTIQTDGDWDSSAGTFTYGTSTLQFTDTANFTFASGDDFYNIIIDVNKTVTQIGSICDVYGTITVNGIMNGGQNVYLQGAIAKPFVIGGSGSVSSVSIIWYLGSASPTTIENATYSNLFVGSPVTCNLEGAITVNNTFRLSGSGGTTTVDTTGGNFGITCARLWLNATATLKCNGSTINVGGSGVLIDTGCTIDADTSVIPCDGDFDASAGTFTPDNSTLQFTNGTVTWSVGTNSLSYYDVIIDGGVDVTVVAKVFVTGTTIGTPTTDQESLVEVVVGHDLTITGTLHSAPTGYIGAAPTRAGSLVGI